MDLNIEHDPDRRHFAAQLDGGRAVLQYAPVDSGTVDFVSTWVPVSLRGQGVGEALVRRAMEWARAGGCRVVPSCWFVRQVAERDPALRELLRV